jgi:Flp pilus assembly protein TadB
MDEPLIIAIGAGAALFILVMLYLPKLVSIDASKRTRNIIDRIASGGTDSAAEDAAPKDEDQIIAGLIAEATGFTKLLLSLPKAKEFFVLIHTAGYGKRVQSVLLGILALFVALSVMFCSMFKVIGLLPAAFLAYFLAKKYLLRQIEKRNQAFLDMFPEAIDMIIRSVKSGHPLNTALRMIADNLDAPVGPEFRQVVNEITYGRPVVEALRRLAKRIDESDINFFVVVLSVQQETGGNLAEILGNLSNVIRGRKRLNQKIRAMTSEGRATGWVLGGLPVFQFGAIYLSNPEYLDPLFNTLTGNMLLALAMGLIGLALWIVSQMIKIDI